MSTGMLMSECIARRWEIDKLMSRLFVHLVYVAVCVCECVCGWRYNVLLVGAKKVSRCFAWLCESACRFVCAFLVGRRDAVCVVRDFINPPRCVRVAGFACNDNNENNNIRFIVLEIFRCISRFKHLGPVSPVPLLVFRSFRTPCC